MRKDIRAEVPELPQDKHRARFKVWRDPAIAIFRVAFWCRHAWPGTAMRLRLLSLHAVVGLGHVRLLQTEKLVYMVSSRCVVGLML